MRTLGLSAFTRRSTAALFDGERAVALHAEEEFSRELDDAGLPLRAARRCLARGELVPRDVDEVVYFEKHLRRFERVLTCELAAFPASLASFPRTVGHWLGEGLWTRGRLVQALGLEPEQMRFASHHASHAGAAFLGSPLEQAAVLVVDDAGEWVTTSIWRGGGSRLEALEELRAPHSLADAALRLARLLGLGLVELDAVAAHGEPTRAERVAALLGADADGSLELDACLRTDDGRALAAALGGGRAAGEPLAFAGADRSHADLAASILQALGDALVALARRALRTGGCADLCLGGELARLPALVERVARESGARETWVPAAPDDAGSSLGAALYARHAVHGLPRSPTLRVAAEELRAQAAHEGSHAATSEACAERLLGGATLARVRSAGGELALGGRAAFAAPSAADGGRALVERHRRDPAWQRPLLLVHARAADETVELHAGLRRAALERPTRARPARGLDAALASACLPDGSLRVRLVDPERERELAELLDACAERGAPPALLAVEFAQRGEVAPRNAAEARERFERSSLDLLDLGGRLYAR